MGKGQLTSSNRFAKAPHSNINQKEACMSARVIEIDPPADRQYDARLWVAMDFTLPLTVVNADSLEQVSSIAPIE
ncbi:MAG: hypothetical protein EA370_18120 [Wenzhouxiangella sp.]|nr:MAG: hypothetical protein EA370_18120 [Wenzhouxiangella sp.]